MDLVNVIVPTILGAQAVLDIPIFFSESEESGSSEEEASVAALLVFRRCKKGRKPQRIENYVELVVPRFNMKQFQQNFRITVQVYEHLITIVGPQLVRQAPVGRPTVNAEKQLLAVIWLLATPDSYRSVGERFDLAKGTVSICFIRIVKILNALAPRVIKWPTEQSLIEIKRKFYNAARLNNVIGAIDGTFIPIKAPKEDKESYITRKCNYAFTLQAIADPFLKFTNIFIGYPGSVSDSRIFKNSDIYHAIENNRISFFPNEEFIIGDKAYPLLSWCIPPYINRGNLTQAQIYFNTVHAQTRQVIERSFALLFGRFRRLKYLDMNRTDMIPATVMAATVLHNICLNFQDALLADYIQDGINHIIHNIEEDHRPNNIAEDGRIRRDEICRNLRVDRNMHNPL